MKIPKIYISKSNACHLDDLIAVRTFLSDYNCEILEYNGGKYDPDLILTADLIVVVPHREQEGAKENTFFVGKGQYSEANKFDDKIKSMTLLLTAINPVSFHLLFDLIPHDPTNFKFKFGVIEINEGPIEITGFLTLK